MSHKWEEWMQTKLRPALRKDRMITFLLAGVLILVISLPTGKKAVQKDEKTEKIEERGTNASDESLGKETEYTMTDEAYVKELEARLREILKEMDGIGDVSVMITLSQSRELIFQKDEKKTQKQTEDNASQTSIKLGREMITEENTVYAENGKEKEPVVIKQIYPKVEGVIIVAEGVGNGNLKAEITEAVQALFGLEAHKIKVLKMGHISSHARIK